VIAVIGLLGVLAATGAAAVMAYDGLRLARVSGADPGRLRSAAAVMLAGAIVAMAALEVAILSHDFSIEYVADNSATTTPFIFLLAAGWAALEGSIVLWGLVLAFFVYIVARRVTADDGPAIGALGIAGLVSVFWFGLMATFANPFAVCTDVIGGVCSASSWWPLASSVAPVEGLGPNPLLQNHILMAVHPPMLYLGYVGFTIPFAFAMSALIRGDQGKLWLERTHRWSVMSWSFLTAGIVLGGWWSYEVLGWGGYWAWDPVENAAFLPWLAATAFIHSAVVQRRRGMLQAWNLVLVIATFSLTIFGTFLTRSGTIFSVHSFTQSAVGPALLAFLAVVVIGSLALFAMRSHVVASSSRLDSLASREGVFLANNLLLTLFAFTVFVGTVYPLVLEAFGGREVTVGRPFFDRAAVPIAFLLLLAMGVGPVTPYRAARAGVVWERIRTPLASGLVVAAAGAVIGVRSIPVILVLLLSGFVISVIVRHLYVQAAAQAGRHDGSLAAGALGLVQRNPGFWGGQISHIGVALVAVAIATSSALAVRAEVRLAPGETAVVDDYCLSYEGAFSREETSRSVDGVDIRVRDASCSGSGSLMRPRINRYPNSTQGIVTPAVRGDFVEDVYISIAGGGANEIILDVFVFPLMWLLWLGGAVTVGGGLWSVIGRRRRDVAERVPVAVSARKVADG
jgi:cytochrome c-type biogenesis protein CcmF